MSLPENKYNLLLKISLVMLVISVALLFISGYHFYFKKTENRPVPTAAVAVKAERDTLQEMYAAALKSLDENFSASWKSADTLSTDLDVKITAFNTLRNDIANILKDQSPTADLGVARQKIIELQIMVNGLRIKNSDVEAENRRLIALLQQLRVNNNTIANIQAPVQQPVAIRTIAVKQETEQTEGPLLTRALQLNAIAADKKTNAADLAERFIGSFLLRNTADKKNNELMLVVLQPDGKVLRNSVWEAGTFESDEGRKAYSKKLYFDPSDDEKQISFSLNPERFFKGEYTMQLWYNGNLVAMLKKALS